MGVWFVVGLFYPVNVNACRTESVEEVLKTKVKIGINVKLGIFVKHLSKSEDFKK